MQIHILTKHWINTRISGAEIYHEQLERWLAAQGHQCTHGPAIPPEADTLITTPFPHYHEAIKSGKRVVFIQHNDTREPYDFSRASFIYCAHHVAAKCRYNVQDATVFYPFNRYAGTDLRGMQEGFFTLANCNDNKGGRLLPELARMVHEATFVGINAGYGNQRRGDVPDNLDYYDPGTDLSKRLEVSAGLLILSRREGLPTVALEAMAMGVPVIGLAAAPGTREAVDGLAFSNLLAIAGEVRRLAGERDYWDARSRAALLRADRIEQARDWDGLKRVLGI